MAVRVDFDWGNHAWGHQKVDPKWIDGKTWKAQKGKDFTSSPDAFRQAIVRFAKKQGVRVKTKIIKNCVYFTFEPKRNQITEGL